MFPGFSSLVPRLFICPMNALGTRLTNNCMYMVMRGDLPSLPGDGVINDCAGRWVIQSFRPFPKDTSGDAFLDDYHSQLRLVVLTCARVCVCVCVCVCV